MSINELIEALQAKAQELGGDAPAVAWIIAEGAQAAPLSRLKISSVSPGYDFQKGCPVAVLHLINP